MVWCFAKHRDFTILQYSPLLRYGFLILYCFLNLKADLKGKAFDDMDANEQNTMQQLFASSETKYKRCFQHCQELQNELDVLNELTLKGLTLILVEYLSLPTVSPDIF